MISRRIQLDTVRQAQELVAELPHGHLLDHVDRLGEWARSSPDEVAALAVVLAAMVDDGGLARLSLMAGLESEVHDVAKREAHRLHARGIRPPHVVTAERAYQREKKQRLRTARPSKGAAA